MITMEQQARIVNTRWKVSVCSNEPTKMVICYEARKTGETE